MITYNAAIRACEEGEHWEGEHEEHQGIGATDRSIEHLLATLSPRSSTDFNALFGEMIAKFDDVDMIADLYWDQETRQLDDSFFSENGVEKFGHKRLFQLWFERNR